VIDRRNYHLFQPLLYQVATASLSPADIASPIRWILRKQKNTATLMAEVTAIDLVSRRVTLADGGTLSYDFLIIAAGAEPSYFGHESWAELAPGLKSIEDALEMRRRIFSAFERAERTPPGAGRDRLLTFVVVGGGPTGVELAGALGEIAHDSTLRSEFRAINPDTARIVLIEGGPRLLDGFPERLARTAARDLAKLGVEVRTDSRVTAIEPGAVAIGQERIEAETILWAAGVRASPLGQSLGLPPDRAGQVKVETNLTVTGHSEVFVIGDLATMPSPNGEPLPGIAPVAIQQGECAAANIERVLTGQPMIPFRYRDRGMLATIGRNRAVAVIFGRSFDGLVAWLLWAVVHIVSIIGFRNRIAVTLQWFWAYLTRQRIARLITSDSDRERAYRLPPNLASVRPSTESLVTSGPAQQHSGRDDAEHA
jgi:NADH dehydrogenase